MIYKVDTVVEKPRPAPCIKRPRSIIQTYWAPAKSEYPIAKQPQEPIIEAHWRPIKLANGPATRLPISMPKAAILTVKKNKYVIRWLEL